MLYQLAQDVELQATQQQDDATAKIEAPHVVIHTRGRHICYRQHSSG